MQLGDRIAISTRAGGFSKPRVVIARVVGVRQVTIIGVSASWPSRPRSRGVTKIRAWIQIEGDSMREVYYPVSVTSSQWIKIPEDPAVPVPVQV